MKVASALSAAALAGVASANPFAAKTSANTRSASYVGGLLAKARPTANSKLPRRLEQQDLDISSYSIKFEKCQYIQQYAEERNEDIDSVIELKRFVIFRLCPNHSCSSCDYEYGEYLIDMETYLESTLKYKEEEQEQYCQACEECGNGDDDAAANGRRLSNVNCNTCYTECQNIENMEENGYVDAAEYVNCEKVYENDNTGLVYYAGAICANSGSRIKVGLFTDEECSQYDASAEMNKYLKNNDGYNVKMSYHLLKQTFVADGCVASCAQVDDNAADDDANNANQQAETSEVCQELYEAAGKCESPHGFADGMDYSNSDYYDVQLENEATVCAFLDDIYTGHYDQSGEVVVTGGRTTFSGGMTTTGGQKFALTFFAIGTAGLAMYAVVLYQRIKSTRRMREFGSGGAHPLA